MAVGECGSRLERCDVEEEGGPERGVLAIGQKGF